MPVYKQPTAKFMYDYVNMHEPCIIVKIFVTESPVNLSLIHIYTTMANEKYLFIFIIF